MNFRGKNSVTGQWAYGDLFQNYQQTFIMQHNGQTCEVERESVGQTTGAKDERGDDIYVDIFPTTDPDIQFHEGELILYQNGSRFEIGKIKKIVSDGAFVYYHDGSTAAKTPFDCMRKIINAYTIKDTSLGGNEEQQTSELKYTCPRCGRKCASLFECLSEPSLTNQCIDCVLLDRYGEDGDK